MATNYASSESLGSINIQVNSNPKGYDPVFVGETGGVANLYAWNIRVPNMGDPVPEVEVKGTFTIVATINDILLNQSGGTYTSLLTGKVYSQDDMMKVPKAILALPAPEIGASEKVTQVILHTNMDYDDDDPYQYINVKGVANPSGFTTWKVGLSSGQATHSKAAAKYTFDGNTLYEIEQLKSKLAEVEKKMDSILGDVINKFVAR